MNKYGDAPSGMTLIIGDPFARGSDHCPDEAPVMEVTLHPFFMDVRPVLNRDFKAFVDGDCYQKDEYWCEHGLKFIRKFGILKPLYWNDVNWNQPDHPVTGISWYEASAYARFVGKELPTEAQWEYAAKGNDSRLYPWGNAPASPKYANYAPDCDPEELVRRSTPWDHHPQNRSPFGCMDMAGNVAEWCKDNYSPNYRWDTTGINPLCITDVTDDHIARGGSGLHDEDYMRCTSRDAYPPTVRDNIVGFRCVINL